MQAAAAQVGGGSGAAPSSMTSPSSVVATWLEPLRRAAWVVALVTALGAALGLLLVVRADHRYAAVTSVVLDEVGSPAAAQVASQAVVDLVESGQVRGGVARVLDVPVARVRPISAVVAGDGTTVELRTSARNPARAELVARLAVAVAVDLQSSPADRFRPASGSGPATGSGQYAFLSPLPAFHAGITDPAAFVTGASWVEVTLLWGGLAFVLSVAGAYVVAYANGWAPETSAAAPRRAVPAPSRV